MVGFAGTLSLLAIISGKYVIAQRSVACVELVTAALRYDLLPGSSTNNWLVIARFY